MKNRNTGLGRGLDSIFYDNFAEESEGGVKNVRISSIAPREGQPRKRFDEELLSTLAESIKEYGIIEPIIVREKGGDFYEIVAGERRYRAAKQAGLEEIPVIITDYDDRKTAQVALIENIQREDLNPAEEARAYKELSEKYDMTQEEISKTIGKSRTFVTNMLRLLSLPEDILDMLSDGRLSAGHARTLLSLEDSGKIPVIAAEIIDKKLSVRETETLVKRANSPKKEEKEEKTDGVDYISVLEKKVQSALGRRVEIKGGKTKTVNISYEDNEDLEDLLKTICNRSFDI